MYNWCQAIADTKVSKISPNVLKHLLVYFYKYIYIIFYVAIVIFIFFI